LFVFYKVTTAAGIPLNDEKFGMLCGNHIYIVRQEDIMTKTILFLFSCFSIFMVSGCQESKDKIPDDSFRLAIDTLVDTKDIIVKHVIVEALGKRSVKVTEDVGLSSVSNVEPIRDIDTMRVDITFVATLIPRSGSPNILKWLIQLKSKNNTAGGPSTFQVEADSIGDIVQLDLQEGLYPLGQDLVVGKFQGKPVVLLVE
jgi:hypothetical protein